MSHKKIWFITGASRGMGVDFAGAAVAAGPTRVWRRAGTATSCPRPWGSRTTCWPSRWT